MMNFLKKRWYLIVALFVVIGVVILQVANNAKAQAVKEKKYTVKRQDLKDVLSLSGQIDADEHIALRFQSSGRLSWVGVKEGDVVKKYQGVASLDQRDVKNRLQKYLNTYVKTRLDFDQSATDNQEKYIGGLSTDARDEALRSLEKSQYDLNNSVLDVELQNLSLEYSYLYTPIEGLVVRVDSPYAGINITPTTAEFEIVNPKTIYFLATADQVDVVKLTKGMTGNVILDAYSDKNIEGKIDNIAFTPKTGETGTVYEIKIFLAEDNSDYRYRYGMTGDVDFILSERNNVLAIPSSYIKTEKTKKYIMKKMDGKKIKSYVGTDGEIDDNTIITSGLREGDIVVE